MADATDVLEAARRAYDDANANLASDQAEATTPDQSRAVQDNHDAALAHYMEAMRTSFACGNADWQEALSDAQQAQTNVDAARRSAAGLPARLSEMTTLTNAVSNLITVAK